jgi:hypothetical protein
LFALATVCFGLALAAVILEIGVVLLLGEQVKFPRHVVGSSFGLRINEPHAVYRHKSRDVNVWFRINGQGMRDDREFARAKPAGKLRIVSLGDSFTIGYEVSGEETFSHVLETKLRAAGLDVEVLNAGVSGFGTAEECAYLERDLFDYSPDLVLVSYYMNDLVDSVRSDLFRLENGKLVEGSHDYVPGGKLADFMNQNALLNFLSGYSNAFALVKESATRLAKRSVVEQNLAQQGHASGAAAPADLPGDDPESARERLLAAALFTRIWSDCRGRELPLVIQSIPLPNANENPTALLELFPSAEFDVQKPGLSYFAAKSVLDPYVGKEKLYWEHSHQHWTPLAHRLDGEALAQLILDRHLLPSPH